MFHILPLSHPLSTHLTHWHKWYCCLISTVSPSDFPLFKCSTTVDSRPSFLPVWTPRTPRCCLYHGVHLGRTSTVSGLMSHSFPFRPWSLFASAHNGNSSASCHGSVFVFIHSSSYFRQYPLLSTQAVHLSGPLDNGARISTVLLQHVRHTLRFCAHAAPRVDQFL
jgi:hypothetical protein